MPKIDLINLDLGKKPMGRHYEIGPFTISLKNDYEEKRILLEKQEDAITAQIEFTNDEKSILLKSPKPQSACWDIFYILSYLTGRVVVDNKISYRFLTKHQGGNNIVDRHDIINAAIAAWNNRINFKNDNEKRPLWLYFEYIQNFNIENKLIFAAIAFEIVLEIALKNIKLDDGTDSDFEKLILLNKQIKKMIKQSDISDKLKSTFLTNVGNWTNRKSVEGMKRYLYEKHFLNNMQISDEVRDRIQFINRLRNTVLHRAEVANIEGRINYKQVLNYTTEFIPKLIQDYLNCKFGIQNFHRVRQTHEDLKGFIYTGKYYGVEWMIPK